MRWAVDKLKIVVEPGGAVALAALLAGKVPRGHGAGGVGRQCRSGAVPRDGRMTRAAASLDFALSIAMLAAFALTRGGIVLVAQASAIASAGC